MYVWVDLEVMKVKVEIIDWYYDVNYGNVLWLIIDLFVFSVMDVDGFFLVGFGVDYIKVFYLLILLFNYIIL